MVVRDHKVAVSQRAAHLSHPKQWQFPGGKANLDEHPQEAARREMGEECGLWLSSLRFSYLGRDKRTVPYSYIGYAFAVTLQPGELMLNAEPEKHSDWQWVTLEELRKLDMIPGIAVYAERLLFGKAAIRSPSTVE